jgi:Flp pilus assembly protein TadD
LGRFSESADCYRRLRDFFPGDAKYWRMSGAARLALGEWESAEEEYRKAAELDTNAVDAHYGRAAALFEMGRDADAEDAIRIANAVDRSWPETVLALARSVILDERLRNYPDARRSALTWARLGIRTIESPQPVHQDTVGLCYAATGNFAKAAEQSRWAVLVTPSGPWGSLHRDRLRDYERRQLPWDN